MAIELLAAVCSDSAIHNTASNEVKKRIARICLVDRTTTLLQQLRPFLDSFVKGGSNIGDFAVPLS